MPKSEKACLVVIFNHRYEANLPVLRRLYSARFDTVRFLVPFFIDGDGGAFHSNDVVTVYDSSFQFQGYIAQALRQLSNVECTHFAFVADDLILHPSLDQTTLVSALNLGKHDAYIKSLESLEDVRVSWSHFLPAAALFRKETGILFRRELPEPDVARSRFLAHGLRSSRISFRNVRGNGRDIARLLGHASPLELVELYRLLRMGRLRYPLARSYSDFVIVPKEKLAEFAHYCGIFAAMRLFVEVAVPTALILTCESIKCEGWTEWTGSELWTEREYQMLMEKYQGDLGELLATFPQTRLYLHPVKLSQWRMPNT